MIGNRAVGVVRARTGEASRWRPLVLGLQIAFTAVGLAVALMVLAVQRGSGSPFAAHDTWAYWIVDPVHPYGEALAPAKGAFLYSPAAAQAMSVLGLLPWEVVRDGWGVAQVIALVGLTGPFAGPLALTSPVAVELLIGNVSLILAAVAVFGLRWPALWSIAILLKVTPGIGLVWFAARREWRKLGIALGVTAAVALVSFALNPTAWFDWAGVLGANQGVEADFSWPPWPVRAAAAGLLVWIGARRDWPWVVPLAVVLSMGHLWVSTLTIAVGAVWYLWTPLVRRGGG